MTTKRKLTQSEWREEGMAMFGTDVRTWCFKCPVCGHVQSVGDFLLLEDTVGKDLHNAAYQECIGRYTGGRDAFRGAGDGPCNYAAYGLFQLGPVTVVRDDGGETHIFDFAPPEAQAEAGGAA